MDFRILGPLDVRDGEREVRLGRGKQRALLALLLLHRDQAISTDRIIDELWGEKPPPTAAKIVQTTSCSYAERSRTAAQRALIWSPTGGDTCFASGSIDLYGQRSLPQIAAWVTATRASVGSTRRASGTSSTRGHRRRRT